MPAPLILIAEDEPNLREILQFQVESAGFRVVTARDGRDALQLAIETPPDLALLDWHMPGMDGLELVRRMRELPDLARIPVIVLSARTTADDAVRALESGANDYVTKPWEREELVVRIRNLVDWTRMVERGPGT